MPKPKLKIGPRILALSLGAMLAWVILLPRHGRPDLSIRLLGYTNDLAGARLAMMSVTNLSAFTILVYLPTIQIMAPTEPRGFTNYLQGNTNQWRQFHAELGSGRSGNFTIPTPAIHAPWRLSFYVYTDLGTAQVLKRLLHGRRAMPFEMEGDWIDNEK